MFTPVQWLFDSALGAGLVLLAGAALVGLLRQPARRQRAAEVTLAACLLVAVLQAIAPAMPRVSLGLLPAPAPALAPENARPARRDVAGIEAFAPAGSGHAPAAPGGQSLETSIWTACHLWTAAHWRGIMVATYTLFALLAATWIVIGHVYLRRLVRESLLPDDDLAAAWRDLASALDRPATLRISPTASRPICFGIRRPVVIVPAALAAPDRRDDLRIVLLHELVHIRRRDAVTWLLASAAQVLFFYQPLYWHLRRQMRLAQEYVADAWAAEDAGSSADYAARLLRLVREDIRPAPVPVGASGALRGPSEFYRRMERLLTASGPVEKRCAPRWTAAAGVAVLALAVGASCLTVQAGRTSHSAPAGTSLSPEDRGIAFLLARQEASGGWLSEVGPAPTALALKALLQAGISPRDPHVMRAVAFLDTFRQSDHGYYRDAEPGYSTAIVLSALALLPVEHFPEAAGRVDRGRAFLASRHKAAADGSARIAGNAWYASPARRPAQAMPAWMDARERSADAVLDTYGSMTYAGLKSMLYAGLSREDPRVRRGVAWIRGHWTLEVNPGLGSPEGLFYYYHTMARTLRAHGEETLVDARGRPHAWRQELAQHLANIQRPDGSWVNSASGRWLEDRPELVTAYAVLALQETRP